MCTVRFLLERLNFCSGLMCLFFFKIWGSNVLRSVLKTQNVNFRILLIFRYLLSQKRFIEFPLLLYGLFALSTNAIFLAFALLFLDFSFVMQSFFSSWHLYDVIMTSQDQKSYKFCFLLLKGVFWPFFKSKAFL